jgi:hypothetical protein
MYFQTILLVIFFTFSHNIWALRYSPDICEDTSAHLSKTSGWAGYNSSDFKTKYELSLSRISNLYGSLFLKEKAIELAKIKEDTDIAVEEYFNKAVEDPNFDFTQMESKISEIHLKGIKKALNYHFEDLQYSKKGVYPGHYTMINEWKPGLQYKYKNYVNAAKVLAPGLCTLDFASMGCGVALPRMIQEISPHIAKTNGGHFSMVNSSISIWSTRKYEKTILLLAQYLLEVYEDARKGKRVKGHFIKDVMRAFELTGLSQEDAWEFIGNLSANWAISVAINFNDFPSIAHIMASYFIIGELAFGLDAFTWSDEGRLYTLPEIVETSCHWGKTYHFWMSAYLSYKQRSQGISRRGAAKASYLSGLLYEMMSPSTGRGLDKIFEEDVFSNHNNSIRLNLAFKAAAAVYGAEYSSGVIRHIDVDEILDQLFYYSQATDYKTSDDNIIPEDEKEHGVYSSEISQLALKFQQAKKLPKAYYKFKEVFGLHPTILDR